MARVAADIEASPQVVAVLISQQWEELSRLGQWGGVCPDECHVRLVGEGWDNWVFMIHTPRGVPVSARLPRRKFAVPLLERESALLARVGPLLSCDFPDVLFVGDPSEAFPAPWLLCSWIEGQDVSTLPAVERRGMAAELGSVLAELHQPGDTSFRSGHWRGGALEKAAEWDWDATSQVVGRTESATLRQVWERSLTAAPYARQPVWVHCDVHPQNLVHKGGRLSGLIDFGDMTVGDPAFDLAAGWWVFDPVGRELFQRTYESASAVSCDESLWLRAAGIAARIVGIAAAQDDRWLERARRIAREHQQNH